jgi:predicted RecB family endonuclease
MVKGAVKGRSSERIARGVLTELGYEILETNKMITVDGEEAFEVDIIALNPEGEKVCIEVKAGEVGVSDVRHAFANGNILDMRCLFVAKDFANDAAKALSEELNVGLIRLSEFYVLLEPEELEVVVKTSIRDVLNEYGFFPLPSWEEVEEDWAVLRSLAKAESFQEAAQNMGWSLSEFGNKLGDMRGSGIFPSGGQSFMELKRHAQQIIARYSLQQKLEDIERRLTDLKKTIQDS